MKQSGTCLTRPTEYQSYNGLTTPFITRGAQALGIALPPSAPAAFEHYYELLETHGKGINLTAISGAEGVATLHFLDSLALLNAAQFGSAKVIDIGSGAGFPGVPLAIAEPSIDLTLLDSTGKRTEFLSHLCAALSIDAAYVHARAEDAARDPSHRGKYDIAVSRAVAKLNALCELCLPFVRTGGMFIAMKGPAPDGEVSEADSAIAALGAELQGLHSYAIPGTDVARCAVIIRKTSETLDKYPRRYARIQKAPL